jgi:hypothetical protein
MNPSSRNARRSRVAVKKKVPPAPRREPKALTDQDLEDCQRLDAVMQEYNLGLPPTEWLTSAELARFAGPLGGSKYRQQWSGYRCGRSPIPFIDKMIFCLRIKDRLKYTPQEVFRSMGAFSALTQFPPGSLLPLVKYMLTEQGRTDSLLTQFLEVYVATPASERAALVRLRKR